MAITYGVLSALPCSNTPKGPELEGRAAVEARGNQGTQEGRKEGREEEIRKKCRGLSVALCRSSSSQKKKENVYKMFAPSELATIRGGGQCVAGT